jgi:hypothetical protein
LNATNTEVAFNRLAEISTVVGALRNYAITYPTLEVKHLALLEKAACKIEEGLMEYVARVNRAKAANKPVSNAA